MRYGHTRRGAFLSLLASLTMGCQSDSPGIAEPDPFASPSFVRLESDAGDYIGGGESYDYTQANSFITVTADSNYLRIAVNADEHWVGRFQSPDSLDRLVPGVYSGVTRYRSQTTAAGSLDWSGESRGCNTLTGSFTIDSLTYNDDVLSAIALRFVQHCDGAASALRGAIHWNSADITEPAGPANPPPTGLWMPPSGSVPANGNYVYLASDSGDYIGVGDTSLYTQANTTIDVWAIASTTYVSVGPWNGNFHAMHTLDRLDPGYYPMVTRYPFHNPVRGGLTWHGNGRGCNELIGWFIVDRVSYSSDDLTALELRFEQRCEGGTPALRGAIRVN